MTAKPSRNQDIGINSNVAHGMRKNCGSASVSLNHQTESHWKQKTQRLLAGLVEHCIRFDQLKRVYDAARRQPGNESFAHQVLQVMDVNYAVDKQDLLNIPKMGTAIVVANHPFGMIEGLVLSDILRQTRPDIRIMANYMLGQIPEMRDLFILVDPFNDKHSRSANIKPMRKCLRWLHSGGILGVFPAGEVAHLDLHKRRIQDPPWTKDIARLTRHTKAVVVPCFFEGTNGLLFQLAGMVHPRLRTALLPREFINKRHSIIRVHIGAPIPFEKSNQFTDDGALVDYLRLRTCMLFHRGKPFDTPFRRFTRLLTGKKRCQTLAAAMPADTLAKEVAALPPEHNLVHTDEYAVYYARVEQIPRLLREIGRLRELTFREANEGSGQALDLDRFDHTYLHLFVWHIPRRELVGAYRIGHADTIVRQSGIRGLYSSTLFKYDRRLMEHLNPALEMGRSFVRPEYQRTYNPLFLLWKGIGAYIDQNPRYTGFFGTVSINNAYQAISRHLLVRFLEHHYFDAEMARLVKPRKPLPVTNILYCDQRLFRNTVTRMEDIATLVKDIEHDHKGIPILLKQYIKLGGRLLAFNLDPAFSYVLDGLIWVDLRKTDRKIMLKYMGAERYACWQQQNPDRNGKLEFRYTLKIKRNEQGRSGCV